jgi:hypothetical protein
MVARCHDDPRFQREHGCHPRNSALPNQIHLVKPIGYLRRTRAQPVAAREVHREWILLPDHQAEEKALGSADPRAFIARLFCLQHQSANVTLGDRPGAVKKSSPAKAGRNGHGDKHSQTVRDSSRAATDTGEAGAETTYRPQAEPGALSPQRLLRRLVDRGRDCAYREGCLMTR